MTPEHELKKFLGVREWLYFTVYDEDFAASHFAQYRLDAITNDVEYKPDGAHNWEYYITGEGLPVGWICEAIQEWYGR